MSELTLLWGILVVAGILVFANFIALFLYFIEVAAVVTNLSYSPLSQETPEISHSLGKGSKWVNPLAIAGCQAIEVFTAVDECLLLSSNFFPVYVNFSISPSSMEHKAHTIFI